jgi:hypothetical protein
MVRTERLLLRTTVRAVKDVIYEDMVQTTKSRDKLDLETHLAFTVTLTTRIKVMRDLLGCFNLLDKNNYKDVMPNLKLLHQRINLHLNQLNRIDKVKYRIAKKYFADTVYILYKYIHCLKKLNY